MEDQVTIEIPRALYDEIKEMAEKRKTQDCRATGDPYYYCVEHEIHIRSQDGDDLKFYDTRTQKHIGIEELFEYMTREYDITKEEEMDDLEDVISSHVAEDIEAYVLEEYGRLIEGYYVTKRHVHDNVFITEGACEEHIRKHGHIYKNPFSYVEHALYSREMMAVVKMIDTIGNAEAHLISIITEQAPQ